MREMDRTKLQRRYTETFEACPPKVRLPRLRPEDRPEEACCSVQGSVARPAEKGMEWALA